MRVTTPPHSLSTPQTIPISLHVRSALLLLAAFARLTPSAQTERSDFTTTPGVFTALNPGNFIGAGV